MTMSRNQVCELIAHELRAVGESATPEEIDRMRAFLEVLDAAKGNPAWPLLMRRMSAHGRGQMPFVARR